MIKRLIKILFMMWAIIPIVSVLARKIRSRQHKKQI